MIDKRKLEVEGNIRDFVAHAAILIQRNIKDIRDWVVKKLGTFWIK